MIWVCFWGEKGPHPTVPRDRWNARFRWPACVYPPGLAACRTACSSIARWQPPPSSRLARPVLPLHSFSMQRAVSSALCRPRACCARLAPHNRRCFASFFQLFYMITQRILRQVHCGFGSGCASWTAKCCRCWKSATSARATEAPWCCVHRWSAPCCSSARTWVASLSEWSRFAGWTFDHVP